jgi:selenocysteine-specific elongation factor
VTVVVGTAGHIDHGKTTLLRALTGIDADRLPEERRRGMTIDVGYAHLALPDGDVLDFVDVPGHDRLVGNMLVGAGEIDAALLVVAADDGPRAQTIEHLELLDGLGIADGLVVVTKIDAVETARVAQVREQAREMVAGTTLRGAAVVVASGTTGAGLAEVTAALVALRDRVAARGLPDGGARLWIDRVFSVRGRGTVVTGTLRGGPVGRGDALTVTPGGDLVRVREVQARGRMIDASNGGRTAFNLVGPGAGRLARGLLVTADPTVIASDRLLVALDRPVEHGSRARYHVGTASVEAAVGRSGRDAVDLPASGVTAVVRLDRPVPAAFGDRFVLRRPSPGALLAGGRVLDANPARGVSRRRATPERLIVLASAATSAEAMVARLDLHGAIGDRLAPDIATWLEDRVDAVVDDRHRRDPEAVGPTTAELRAALVRELRRQATIVLADAERAVEAAVDRRVEPGIMARTGDRVHRPDHRPADRPEAIAAMERLEAALDVAAPPALDEAARSSGCPPDAVGALEAEGRIVRVDETIAWSRRAYERLVAEALELASREPLTPARLRDATGTSRKYVMALLEDLDRRGVLRRTPSGHVPGPRAGLVVAER